MEEDELKIHRRDGQLEAVLVGPEIDRFLAAAERRESVVEDEPATLHESETPAELHEAPRVIRLTADVGQEQRRAA